MSVQYANTNAPIAGDPIAQLPVDQVPPNPSEIQIIDTLFKKHRGTMEVIAEESKDAMLVGILVIVSCLPQINSLINKLLPMTSTSIYIMYLIKGLGAAIFYWLIKHFYLSRKSS